MHYVALEALATIQSVLGFEHTKMLVLRHNISDTMLEVLYERFANKQLPRITPDGMVGDVMLDRTSALR